MTSADANCSLLMLMILPYWQLRPAVSLAAQEGRDLQHIWNLGND